MGWRCAVASCRKVNTKGFSAYAFPADPILRAKWVEFCGRAPQSFIPEDKKSRICEYHFDSNDFLGNDGRQHLKYGTVPTNNGCFDEVKQEPEEEDNLNDDNDNSTFLDDEMVDTEGTYVDPLVGNSEVLIEQVRKDQPKLEISDTKNKSCRICMTESAKQFISLFAKLKGEYVAQMMTFCTSLEVERDDLLPQYICEGCFQKLRAANSLKLTSIESDTLWRNQAIKQEDFEEVNGYEFEQFIDFKEEPNIMAKKSKNRSFEPDNSVGSSPNSLMINDEMETRRRIKKTVRSSTQVKKVRKEPLLKIEIQKFDQDKQHLQSCLDCGMNYKEEQNHRCYTTKFCSICSTMVGSQKLLVQHFKESHITDRECKTCKLVLSSALDLHFHIRTHSAAYICEVCGKAFSKADYLKRHIPSHFEHFQCDHCNIILKRKTGLQRHMNTIHLNTTQKLVCNECGLSFKTSNVLQFHLIRFHNAPSNCQCKKCGKKFVYPSQLKGHDMRVHLKIIPPASNEFKAQAYKCSFCTKSFKLHSIMQAHEKLHTDGVPMLNNHFLKHKCMFCGKRFQHKNLLNDHVTVHTKERAFKCYNCEKTFKTTIGLRKHLKNIHKEIKPFVSSDPNYIHGIEKFEDK